ncbi:MAG TPA: hypothetical protein V6C84_27130 [Coleofasciculaceae cyanobacterium]|jgi:hypothetical protein
MERSVINPLVEQIGKVLIIAYRESTDRLQATFVQEGFECEVLRQPDKPEYQTFASIYRCLLNHQQAWVQVAQSQQPTLIVEADFVPVVGLGNLPLPFNPTQADVGMAWLYTCAPQLYNVTADGFADGFSTTSVAYVLTPQGAIALQGFVDDITAKHGTGYYNFDSELDGFLRAQNLKNYLPWRNYGEHGGKANPEHRRHGMSGLHRADVLWRRLAFLPGYAELPHSYLHFFWARLQARLKGIARLALGKYLRPKVLRNSSHPRRLLSWAIQRQVRGCR